MSPFGPYSPVQQAGQFYFTAGQVGIDPTSKRAPKDVAAQTAQALANLAAVLEDEGLDMRHVIKTTIHLTTMDDFAAMNEVYVGHFEAPRPARTCVAVKELPRLADKPLLVEIEAVAYKGSS